MKECSGVETPVPNQLHKARPGGRRLWWGGKGEGFSPSPQTDLLPGGCGGEVSSGNENFSKEIGRQT